jgi:hypothetical protein
VLIEMVGESIKSNVKDRVEALTIIPDNFATGLSVGVDRLTELKPVQAVAEFAQHLGDGVFKFVDKQAEITRRWAGKAGQVIK